MANRSFCEDLLSPFWTNTDDIAFAGGAQIHDNIAHPSVVSAIKAREEKENLNPKVPLRESNLFAHYSFTDDENDDGQREAVTPPPPPLWDPSEIKPVNLFDSGGGSAVAVRHPFSAVISPDPISVALTPSEIPRNGSEAHQATKAGRYQTYSCLREIISVIRFVCISSFH